MGKNSKTWSSPKERETIKEEVSDSFQKELSSRDVQIDELTEEMKKLNGEMWKMREENKTIREEKEERERENAMLKATIAGTEIMFSPDAWMRVEMEDMRLSTAKLNEKTMEVYRTIWEKGVMKAHSRSTEERKKLVEEIQKLEDLCEQITKDVKKAHREWISQISNHLYNVEEPTGPCETTQNNEEKRPMDPFVGRYQIQSEKYPLPKFIEITKAAKDMFYDECWTALDGREYKRTWTPDDVERDGFRARIEDNILKINWKGDDLWHYELCGNLMKLGGYAFYRI